VAVDSDSSLVRVTSVCLNSTHPGCQDGRGEGHGHDVERVLIPHLGRLCLADLDTRRLRAIFTEIAQTTNTKGQPQSASAMQHLRTTLRAALNLAVREGVIAANPARHIEVPAYRKPHAKVWTDGRVEEWERTGERPSVAVWTADQLATFLNTVTTDALFALWWLTALRGLRRGEACGLRWSELDLEHGVLFVVRNRTTAGYQVIEGEPKTPARPANVKKPQVTPPVTGTAPRTVTTPPRHPRDTHRPHRTDTKKRSTRVSAGKPPLDGARPKGLEPPTF
jgi:integrase